MLSKPLKSISVGAGPPFLSGKPHLGTVYNTILKNFFLSSIQLEGQRPDFLPAFDCHGASIEKRAKDIKEAEEYIKNSREQFLNMYKKILLRYTENNSVATDDIEYRKFTCETFLKLVKMNKVYEKNKVVQFCSSNNSIVSMSDLKEVTETRKCIYWLKKIGEMYALIYTTTPFTADYTSALAVSKNIKYVVYKYGDKRVVARENLDIEGFEPIHEYKINQEFFKFSDFVYDNFSGILNVVPLYSDIDYEIGQIYNLEHKVIPISHDINQEDDIAIEKIKSRGELVKIIPTKVTSKYNLRSERRTYDFVSKQIFIDISDKEKALNFLKDCNMAAHKEQLYKSISSRDEWCISRQRAFGVAIPFNHLNKSEEEYMNDFNAFIQTDMRNWSKIHGCKEHNTFTCWFESAILNMYSGRGTYDIVIEGQDQCSSGWFNVGFLMNAFFDQSFSKNIYTHGYVCSQVGVKMSKSKGNSLTLDNWEHSIDVLYLLFAGYNYSIDIVLNDESIKAALYKYKYIKTTIESIKKLDNIDTHEYAKSHIHFLINKTAEALDNKKFSIVLEYWYRSITEYTKLYTKHMCPKYLLSLWSPFIYLFMPEMYTALNIDFTRVTKNLSVNIKIKDFIKQRTNNKEINEYYAFFKEVGKFT